MDTPTPANSGPVPARPRWNFLRVGLDESARVVALCYFVEWADRAGIAERQALGVAVAAYGSLGTPRTQAATDARTLGLLAAVARDFPRLLAAAGWTGDGADGFASWFNGDFVAAVKEWRQSRGASPEWFTPLEVAVRSLAEDAGLRTREGVLAACKDAAARARGVRRQMGLDPETKLDDHNATLAVLFTAEGAARTGCFDDGPGLVSPLGVRDAVRDAARGRERSARRCAACRAKGRAWCKANPRNVACDGAPCLDCCDLVAEAKARRERSLDDDGGGEWTPMRAQLATAAAPWALAARDTPPSVREERRARLARYLDVLGRDLERRGPAFAALAYYLRHDESRAAVATLFGVTPKALRHAEDVLEREAGAA